MSVSIPPASAPACDELGSQITQQRWEAVLCQLEEACLKARQRDAYAVKIEAAILKTCPTIQAVLLRLPATGFENMKDDLRGVLAELGYAISDDAQSTTERSASAQIDRESGSVRTRGVATSEMHESPADFQRTPHGSEGSASPLHPLRAVPGGAAEALARRFHDLYERLAPEYGYETRPETRTFEPYTTNGRLMVAVCGELIGPCEERPQRPLPTWLSEGEQLLAGKPLPPNHLYGSDVLVAWECWWKRNGSDVLRMALHDYRSGGPCPPEGSSHVSYVIDASGVPPFPPPRCTNCDGRGWVHEPLPSGKGIAQVDCPKCRLPSTEKR